jgi:hypothetical protein
LYPLHGAVRGRKQPLGVSEEDGAGGRELHTPGTAVQQCDGERCLEHPDLLTDGLLSNVQFLGSAREVAVLGDGYEVTHLPEVRGHDPAPILWRVLPRDQGKSDDGGGD